VLVLNVNSPMRLIKTFSRKKGRRGGVYINIRERRGVSKKTSLGEAVGSSV